MRRAGSVAGWVAAVWIAAAGCKGESGGEQAAPPPLPEAMTQAEADTGREACARYAEQVCLCAVKFPELASECDMAPSRSEAFELNARAAMAEGDANLADRRAMLANSRKIVRACIQESAALVQRGCPMEAGDAPSAGDTPSTGDAPSAGDDAK